MRSLGSLLTALALAVLGGGCLEPLSPCQDGTYCPATEVCSPAGGCAPNHLVEACVPLVDGAPCGAFVRGVCRDRVCREAVCGDGYAELDEICDDGGAEGDASTCNSACTSDESCGNGATDPGEQCDDGNLADADGCQATCRLARCGDLVIDALDGETCDDGNRTDGDGCSRDCLSNERCGNGLRDPGEECDDGNLADHDGCQGTCVIQGCGDGIVDEIDAEVCDDGNTSNNDACRNDCQPAACHDGILHIDVELCDDGNSVNTDACVDDCVPAQCGDGYVQAGVEPCDDANGNEEDYCSEFCVASSCGDGTLQSTFETCDDGNADENDFCSGCAYNCDLIDVGCLKLMSDVKTFADAEEHCLTLEGHLWSVDLESEEQEMLLQRIVTEGETWIGITYDPDNERWGWIGGQTFGALEDGRWLPGYPVGDGECAFASSDGDIGWRDGPCTTSLPYVCEGPLPD